MQIEARFRRRASVGENIAELNGQLLARLSRVTGLWQAGQSTDKAYFDSGDGESAATNLSGCLENGIEGAMSYASRLPAAICDKAISDDTMTLVLETDSVDFKRFCHSVFPEIVNAFEPYRASVVTDLDQDLDDFEQIVEEVRRTGLDVDGRDSVFRIHPVNFFDNALCLRAFGISSDDVASRCAGLTAPAKSFGSGVLLWAADEPLLGAQLDEIEARIRPLLEA